MQRASTNLPSILVVSLAVLVLTSSARAAQEDAGGPDTIRIAFKCDVEYLDHSPPLASDTLLVELAPAEGCAITFPHTPSAIPLRGGVSGNVQTVDVRAIDDGRALLTVRFREPTRYTVSGDDGGIDIAMEILRVGIESEVDADVPVGTKAPALSDERVTSLMAEAKQAFIDGDHARTVQIYTRVLEEADRGHHATALEYLGVAHEASGMLALAVADYRNYLARFGGNTGAKRVEQRLAALLTADIAGTSETTEETGSDWTVYGGFQQEFIRYANREHQDAPDRLTQQALLSFADLLVSRQGERFEWRARLNSAYQKDLMEDPQGPGDQGLVSNAYIEVVDQVRDWSARAGRQTIYEDGVLGRFDGVRGTYRYRPDLALNVTAGMPVASPRYLADDRRPFFGTSARLTDVAGMWDFAAHGLLQRHDGIADRESIGGEIRFRQGRWFALGQVDHDLGYNVVNSALALTSVALTDRIRISARYNLHAYPFITTTNALIGQPTTRMDDLLDLYTEAQVRTIARDRTAQAVNASVGLSATLSQKWHLNGRIGYLAIDGSRESAGVAARPDTGLQLHYAATAIGSSVFKPGDTTTVGYRLQSTRLADTHTVVIDTRLPYLGTLRVSPRVAVSWRETAQSQALVVNPVIRLGYRWRTHYRIELEAGGRWSSEQLPAALVGTPLYPDDREQTFGSYIHLRWGADY